MLDFQAISKLLSVMVLYYRITYLNKLVNFEACGAAASTVVVISCRIDKCFVYLISKKRRLNKENVSI